LRYNIPVKLPDLSPSGKIVEKFDEQKLQKERYIPMTKAELITAVSEKTEMNKKSAEAAVNAVLAAIADDLAAGNRVQLAGFGTFEVKTRAARTGLNPRTKETIEIPESKSVGFKPAKPLKDAVAK
jgi:DNA-binding protein HU-beta